MKKVHNFFAGPCVLPQQAVDKAIEALKDFKGTGVPVISISHRSKEWVQVMDDCRALWKELLHIPDTHEVLFMGGGASLQFLCVAMNFLEKKAGYLETGVWAKKALKEAKGIGEAYAVASSADTTFNYIPKGYEIPADLDYFHITTNNTIYGTQIKEDIDSPVPLIADMSSDIMSRPRDVSKYALIYGGAQKNVGPAGVAFAIVKKDALGKVSRYIPTMLNYQTHIDGGSMFNTPRRCGDYLRDQQEKGRHAVCRDRQESSVHRDCGQGRPFGHERMLRDGSRLREPAGRVPRVRERPGNAGYQGTPVSRRLQGFHLQCLPCGERGSSDQVHAGIRINEKVTNHENTYRHRETVRGSCSERHEGNSAESRT